MKYYKFQLTNFLGVDFSTHESEVNTRRSPDSINMISGQTGSMDKRLGYAIEHIFDGKVWAIKTIKTSIYELVTRNILEIDVIVVHAGTKLWGYNPYLDTWEQAIIPAGDLINTNPVLQQMETQFIEYSNQNYWTLVHNNWVTNKNDLLVLYCKGDTTFGNEGKIWLWLNVNDLSSTNLYFPTTSIGRSPSGLVSTPYERANGCVTDGLSHYFGYILK